MLTIAENSLTTRIDGFLPSELALFLKREELLHPIVSGNKWRKLKYNIEEIYKQGLSKIITFGGAYSNHIAAVAFAGSKYGFDTIGVIRGEKPEILGSTLVEAQRHRMKLEFVSRSDYRNKSNPEFLNSLIETHGPAYVLPEGGANSLGVKGCEEILDDVSYDYVCCAAGTGTTAAGILNSMKGKGRLLIFPALKDAEFLNANISEYSGYSNYELVTDYHFGGYAKTNPLLFEFMKDFESQTDILLDPVYTAKMMYGIKDLSIKRFFASGSKILAIHTGGLQGRAGFGL